MAKVKTFNPYTGKMETLLTWDTRRNERKFYPGNHKFKYTKSQDQAVLRMGIKLLKIGLLLIAIAWVLGFLGIIK